MVCKKDSQKYNFGVKSKKKAKTKKKEYKKGVRENTKEFYAAE